MNGLDHRNVGFAFLGQLKTILGGIDDTDLENLGIGW